LIKAIVAEVACSLGIRANRFYDWKKQIEQSKASVSLNNNKRAELSSLRKEVKILCMEKDILKKASEGRNIPANIRTVIE